MKTITRFAKENRKKQTPAEKALSIYLRKAGVKYRTQRMYDYYIADFLIPDKWLIVEIDGGYHRDREDYDRRRTEYLSKKGFSVLRFENETVLSTPSLVVAIIKNIPNKPTPDRKHILDLYGRSAY